MGLEISAFSKARFVSKKEPVDEDVKYYAVYARERTFARRLDRKKPGYYISNSGEDFYFNVRNYWRFSQWRLLLSLTIFGVDDDVIWDNLRKYAQKPFYEILYMSNFEGAIGPETSKKLAKDFQDFYEIFKEKLPSIRKRFAAIMKKRNREVAKESCRRDKFLRKMLRNKKKREAFFSTP